MDMLLTAAADALARRAMSAEHHIATPADEDSYYSRHTLDFILPGWLISLVALLRRGRRNAPQRIRAARHA